MKRNKITLGQFFGYSAIGLITVGVLVFLASHSLSFFQFTFAKDAQIYAWLGLLLTSGGAIGWLAIFETLADTVMKKGIALSMMVIGILGEMATAVFDMQYSSSYGTGFNFAVEELRSMTMLVGVLGALTGLALIMFFSGDHIIKAFGDHDGDGVPNFLDPDYKKQQRQFASETEEIAALEKRLSRLQARNPQTAGGKQNQPPSQ